MRYWRLRLYFVPLILVLVVLACARQPEAAQVSWRFVDAQGKPVPGVSRLRIVPDKLDGNISHARNDNFYTSITNLVDLSEQADGSYQLTTEYTGTYRLLVDLYDENVPLPPQLLLTVKPGAARYDIPLPAPLMNLPAGTEISWVTRNAPASRRRIVVGAQAPAMPVYGPSEGLLAYWYTTTPNHLRYTILDIDGHKTEHDSTLRSVYLTPQLAGGTRYTGSFSLLPLLPGSPNSEPQSGGNHLVARPDEASTILGPETGYRADLWSGPYLVIGARADRVFGPPGAALKEAGEFRTIITIPDTGAAEITFPVTPRPRTSDHHPVSRTIGAVFPKADYDMLRKGGANFLVLTFDGDQRHWYLVAGDALNKTTIWNPNVKTDPALKDAVIVKLDIPPTARTMSIRWLGVGEIGAVTIRAAEGEKPTIITLPAWQDGATIAGQVLNSDGTARAGAQLTLATLFGRQGGDVIPELLIDESYSGSHFGPPVYETLPVLTGAQGDFTVKGVAAREYVLAEKFDLWNLQGWTFAVPATGLAHLSLRASAEPVTILWQNVGMQSWWLPDKGTPERVWAGKWYNLAAGTGWLWQVDDSQGYMGAAHVRLIPGAGEALEDAHAPSLSLNFPAATGEMLPGAVTLIGLDARAGVTIYFSNVPWQLCPALGPIIGDISAVPPGSYRVLVETPRGTIDSPVTVTDTGACLQLEFPGEEK